MNRQRAFFFPMSGFAAVFLMLGIGFFALLPAQADATTYTAPASCTGSIGGADGKSLVVTTVYCIQQSISSAVFQFVTALEANLQSYQYMAMAMVFGFYGIKLITGGVDEVMKESATLLFKMGWAFILIEYATWIYPVGAATMDELIGWVTNGVSGFSSASSTMASTCPALASYPLGANPLTYGVWHEMDCMINSVLGTTTTPTDILTSMAAVVVPSLVSSTNGFISGAIAVFATGVMLFMLIRALYTVLLSYLTLAILVILTPLIAPVLFFNSAYCKDLFDRWLGLIISTLFQPMFIMGFLSFAVQIEDTFISGKIPGCIPATFDSVSLGTMTNTGSGLCSAAQLNMTGANIANQTEPNAIRGTAATSADIQYHTNDSNKPFQPSTQLNTIKTGVVGGANQSNYAATSIGPPQFTRLKPSPSLQFMESMIAFALVTLLLNELMGEVPEMARSITLSVGVGFRNVVDPITGEAMGILNGAKTGALTGLKTGGGIFSGAIKGAGGGALSAGRTAIKGI